MTLPPPWDEYFRLQSKLDGTTQVDNRSWGFEAGLDAQLARAALPPSLPNTSATAERRERYRARLRRTYPTACWPSPDQSPAAIEARVELEQIRRQLPTSDWQLISSVAIGTAYQAIGHDLGATPDSLRVRVSRIRDRILRIRGARRVQVH